MPCRGDRGYAGRQDDKMIFSAPKEKLEDLVLGLEQKRTGAIPTRFSMPPKYRLSVSYAEIARLMGMEEADGTEIKGVREYILLQGLPFDIRNFPSAGLRTLLVIV